MSTPEKPNRLSGLIAPKGIAPRPLEEAQHTIVPEPAATRSTPSAPAPPQPALGSKSLTLRLPDPEYERLRAYAFASRKTHQAILAEALKAFLDTVT